MNNNFIANMTNEELYLFEQSMSFMDKYYDSSFNLLQYRNGSDDDVRGSAHYALGLLMRGKPEDLDRAFGVINKVLEMQYDAPNEIYHGTFKVAPNKPNPPQGNMNWKSFSPGFAYFLDTTFEKIKFQLAGRMSEAQNIDRKQVERYFDDAVNSVLPKVWDSYDPNWREFITTTLAVILENFEDILPKELVERMDTSVKRAVGASIDRYLSDAIPMNTNIILMHIFITGYFGERYSNKEWAVHAEKEAINTYNEYMELKSFAEFNSTTYYGVDLMTLGLWRKYLKNEKLKDIGEELEDCLWENISLFYNPNLKNVGGPFARCYEMDMVEHSSLGQFLFMALGEKSGLSVGVNTETSHDPLVILSGSNMPEHLKPYFTKHQKDRQVEKKFRELCERGKPGENRTLCTATAWIEKDIMLGAMSGSNNTSGQLHPVTIYWKSPDGKVYSIRLLRRLKGGHWSQHLKGIRYNAEACKDRINFVVDFDIKEDIELFFEIDADNVCTDLISPEKWDLPGLTAQIRTDAPKPVISMVNGKLEVIYLYDANNNTCKSMNFEIKLVR